jgi:hypothetical protein
MPWKTKRLLYQMCLGFTALVLALVVLARDRSLDTELLGYLGIVGGTAIILNALPFDENGNGKRR